MAAVTWCSTAKLAPHPVDEYVQSALVGFSPERVYFSMVMEPGAQVAEQVLAEIDLDANNRISQREVEQYGAKFLAEIELLLDGKSLKPVIKFIDVPRPSEIREGWAIVRLGAVVEAGKLPPGEHSLVFINQHFPSISAYQFNAEKSTSEHVEILEQNRNADQSRGEIRFRIEGQEPATLAASTSEGWPWTGLVVAAFVAVTCLSAWFFKWWRVVGE
jgi:hypothetical protein